jgi:hypothetical protein
VWTGWRVPLVYVQADTVVRWQRERFRRFWARFFGVNSLGALTTIISPYPPAVSRVLNSFL